MSIRQDSRTKKWYYRFWRGRSYFRGGFRTYDQAKKAEVGRLNRVIENGVYASEPARELTLAEAAKLFFENHSQKNKRSWKNDRARVAAIGNFFKKTPMKDVTPEGLEEFLDRLQERCSIKDSTRNHYLALIKAIYNRHEESGDCIGVRTQPSSWK